MMTMTMVELSVPTTHEIVSTARILDRVVVRSIWGRGLGSTYQRSVNGKGSIFSMALSCPECRGSFELSQPEGNSHDCLVGTCSNCKKTAQVTVGAEGRITQMEDVK